MSQPKKLPLWKAIALAIPEYKTHSLVFGCHLVYIGHLIAWSQLPGVRASVHAFAADVLHLPNKTVANVVTCLLVIPTIVMLEWVILQLCIMLGTLLYFYVDEAIRYMRTLCGRQRLISRIRRLPRTETAFQDKQFQTVNDCATFLIESLSYWDYTIERKKQRNMLLLDGATRMDWFHWQYRAFQAFFYWDTTSHPNFSLNCRIVKQNPQVVSPKSYMGQEAKRTYGQSIDLVELIDKDEEQMKK